MRARQLRQRRLRSRRPPEQAHRCCAPASPCDARAVSTRRRTSSSTRRSPRRPTSLPSGCTGQARRSRGSPLQEHEQPRHHLGETPVSLTARGTNSARRRPRPRELGLELLLDGRPRTGGVDEVACLCTVNLTEERVTEQ
ncbi:hypothetical protein ACFPRL_05915 [Pseudoclavibacter helvolus]